MNKVLKAAMFDKRNLAKWAAGAALVLVYGFAEADTTIVGKDVLSKEKADQIAVYILGAFTALNRSAEKPER